jgi:hypothetical protein
MNFNLNNLTIAIAFTGMFMNSSPSHGMEGVKVDNEDQANTSQRSMVSEQPGNEPAPLNQEQTTEPKYMASVSAVVGKGCKVNDLIFITVYHIHPTTDGKLGTMASTIATRNQYKF